MKNWRKSAHDLGYYRYAFKCGKWTVTELTASYLEGFIECWTVVKVCDNVGEAIDISRQHNKEYNKN